MTKKTKGNSMSLKDFYEKAPGDVAPLAAILPSKHGETAKNVDLLGKHIADIKLGRRDPTYASSGHGSAHQDSDHYGFGPQRDIIKDNYYAPGGSAGADYYSYHNSQFAPSDYHGVTFTDGASSFGAPGAYDPMQPARRAYPLASAYPSSDYCSHCYSEQQKFVPPPPPPRIAAEPHAEHSAFAAPPPPRRSSYSSIGGGPFEINSALVGPSVCRRNSGSGSSGNSSTGLAPPPPPPRRAPEQRVSSGNGDDAGAGTARPALSGGHRISQDAHESSSDAKDQAAKAFVSKALEPVQQPETQRQPKPEPKPEPVQNDWADRMAKAALARMASARSTLLASELQQEPSKALDAAAPADGSGPKPLLRSGRPRRVLESNSSGSDAPRLADSTTRMPAVDGARPRLSLQPRSKPLEQQPSAAADAQEEGASEWRRQHSGAGTGVGGARPRLALAPRTRPLEPEQQPKSSSIFGAAKPREEVLRERGLDAASMDGSFGSRPVSAAVSAASVDDEWQTVGKGRRAGAGAATGMSDLLVLDDPLLGSTRPVSMGAARPYGDHHGGSCGSFGSYGRHFPHSRFEVQAHQQQADQNEGDDVFRRALPMRSGLF